MRNHLIFTLVAPMGSFGDLAGHELRGSYFWPGRSALLGLVGGALGVRRDDKSGQATLTVWKTAVSVLSVGIVWQDFHTIQTVPSARIKRPETRQEALSALRRADNGVITRRNYCNDCVFGVAMWGGDIQLLEAALRKPVFVPYLGRKNCPLSAPMSPKIVSADTSIEALTQVILPPFLNIDTKRPKLVITDENIPGGWTEVRWDEPLDRAAWHFGQRRVRVLGTEFNS
ncbi:MAG: type I-E CRISPR-associated protein Cas5/CasD [Aestuariivita sp.]|nr:type I-E CRISPR-associated protein Cas5/CasD [Aestuariivita sp.]